MIIKKNKKKQKKTYNTKQIESNRSMFAYVRENLPKTLASITSPQKKKLFAYNLTHSHSDNRDWKQHHSLKKTLNHKYTQNDKTSVGAFLFFVFLARANRLFKTSPNEFGTKSALLNCFNAVIAAMHIHTERDITLHTRTR